MTMVEIANNIRQVTLSIFGVLMILLAVNIRIEWLVLGGILPRKRLRV